MTRYRIALLALACAAAATTAFVAFGGTGAVRELGVAMHLTTEHDADSDFTEGRVVNVFAMAGRGLHSAGESGTAPIDFESGVAVPY